MCEPRTPYIECTSEEEPILQAAWVNPRAISWYDMSFIFLCRGERMERESYRTLREHARCRA